MPLLVDFSFLDMHGNILLLVAHTKLFPYMPLFWGPWLKSLPILSQQREQTLFLFPQKKTHYRRMLHITTFLPVMLNLSPLASYNSSAVSWVLKETSLSQIASLGWAQLLPSFLGSREIVLTVPMRAPHACPCGLPSLMMLFAHLSENTTQKKHLVELLLVLAAGIVMGKLFQGPSCVFASSPTLGGNCLWQPQQCSQHQASENARHRFSQNWVNFAMVTLTSSSFPGLGFHAIVLIACL